MVEINRGFIYEYSKNNDGTNISDNSFLLSLSLSLYIYIYIYIFIESTCEEVVQQTFVNVKVIDWKILSNSNREIHYTTNPWRLLNAKFADVDKA